MFLVKNKSGKRDSNSRPQPWQGCALPTELFPQIVTQRYSILTEQTNEFTQFNPIIGQIKRTEALITKS